MHVWIFHHNDNLFKNCNLIQIGGHLAAVKSDILKQLWWKNVSFT